MKLTEDEKKKLRSLVTDPRWPVISNAIEIYCYDVAQNSPIRDTQYETLKILFTQEGKIQGVREFFQRLQEQSFREED